MSPLRRWASGGLVALDLGAGVLVLRGGEALLVDAGEGLWRAWREAGLPCAGPAAVAFTAGDPGAVGGLWTLLARTARAGRREHHLLHAMPEERVPALAGAWELGEGRRLGSRVLYEAVLPGQPVEVGSLRATCLAWEAPGGTGAPGVAWAVEAPEGRLVVAGTAGEPRRVARAVAGAGLVAAPGAAPPGLVPGTWWRRG